MTGLGTALHRSKAYDRAIDAFTRAIALDPKDGLIFTMRGNSYLAKEDYQRAIADFDKAITLDPRAALAIFLRGQAHMDRGDPTRARANFEAAMALPDVGGTHDLARKLLAQLPAKR